MVQQRGDVTAFSKNLGSVPRIQARRFPAAIPALRDLSLWTPALKYPQSHTGIHIIGNKDKSF